MSDTNMQQATEPEIETAEGHPYFAGMDEGCMEFLLAEKCKELISKDGVTSALPDMPAILRETIFQAFFDVPIHEGDSVEFQILSTQHEEEGAKQRKEGL